MKIETGKKYVTRNGVVVHIIEADINQYHHPDQGYIPMRVIGVMHKVTAGSPLQSWTVEGKYTMALSHEYDLVAEYVPLEEYIGTMVFHQNKFWKIIETDNVKQTVKMADFNSPLNDYVLSLKSLRDDPDYVHITDPVQIADINRLIQLKTDDVVYIANGNYYMIRHFSHLDYSRGHVLVYVFPNGRSSKTFESIEFTSGVNQYDGNNVHTEAEYKENQK